MTFRSYYSAQLLSGARLRATPPWPARADGRLRGRRPPHRGISGLNVPKRTRAGIDLVRVQYIYPPHIYIYEVGDCSRRFHLGPHWTVSYPNPNRFTLDVTVHTDSVHFYSVTVDETRRCTRFDLRPLTKLDEVWGGREMRSRF